MSLPRTSPAAALVAAESSAGAPGLPWLQCVCQAVVHSLPAYGSGVTVLGHDGSLAVAAASDVTSLALEELQFLLGVGPCVDALSSRRPVLHEHLIEGVPPRWLGYRREALGRGVRAVFAFPLQLGAARLGVLDIYRSRPGSLSTAELSLALDFAAVAMLGLLDQSLAPAASRPQWVLADALEGQMEIYQAQGIVVVQLSVGPAEAMVRLRAHAYAEDRNLLAVARDVVAGRLHLPP